MNVLATICSLAWLAGQVFVGQELQHSGTDQTTIDKRRTAYAAALYALACERVAANERRGEIWVMTTHRSASSDAVMKYQSGPYVVVSVPVLRYEEAGIDLHIRHCNSLVERKADLLALKGQGDEAQQIYRLLERFRRPVAEELAILKQKMQAVENLKRGIKPEIQRALLRELTVDYGPSVWEGVNVKDAHKVSNLLELDQIDRSVGGAE